MSLLPKNATKTFNLLNIGQRGVGKTVFLAGSYVELHAESAKQQLWFDCQDDYVQENVEKIFNYVVQTHQYPPPTMKVTNFSFSLKRHSRAATQTLCHFNWLDIPGEICQVHNLDFRRMVSSSHGCCVFVDAHALLHNNSYLQVLEAVIKQVAAIASLVHLNGLNYWFAIVLTKCDLIQLNAFNRKRLEENLQPLTHRLDAVSANYQTFFSSIPIEHAGNNSTLKATGAAAPLLWLVCELMKTHNPKWTSLLNSTKKPSAKSLQLQQGVVEGLVPSLTSVTGKSVRVRDFGLHLPLGISKYIGLLLVIGVAGTAMLSLWYHEWNAQRESQNILTTLSNVATLRQQGQYGQAIPLMEQLVQQQPERAELRLQLAYLYEITQQLSKAESAYDQVLAQQQQNFKALIGKAKLRNDQGDVKTAKALLAQAKQVDSTDFELQAWTETQKLVQQPAK